MKKAKTIEEYMQLKAEEAENNKQVAEKQKERRAVVLAAINDMFEDKTSFTTEDFPGLPGGILVKSTTIDFNVLYYVDLFAYPEEIHMSYTDGEGYKITSRLSDGKIIERKPGNV